jgi:hypothetical protein
MTASELARYFGDRKFFTDPDQEVRFFILPTEDTPLEKGTELAMRGSTVPERGEAIVAFRPAPMGKYMFSLKFEANPVIEAHTVEEAEAKAYKMMRTVAVVKVDTTAIDESFVAQEPYFMEEVER